VLIEVQQKLFKGVINCNINSTFENEYISSKYLKSNDEISDFSLLSIYSHFKYSRVWIIRVSTLSKQSNVFSFFFNYRKAFWIWFHTQENKIQQHYPFTFHCIKVRVLKQKHATKENLQSIRCNFNLLLSLPGNREWFWLDWINAHEQEITDKVIVNEKNESSDEASDDKNRQTKICHKDGLRAIESAIEYREQQEEPDQHSRYPLKKTA